jgi:trimeric autotransporter adhesin
MRILQSPSASKSTPFHPKKTLFASGLGLLLLAGCGGQPLTKSVAPAPHAAGRNGSIYGGQQPVSGATVQLYAVGTTGDGSAATPLFTSPVVSDGSGNFTFAAYTCPTPNTLVYIVATGGNPGLPGPVNNTALALMAAISQYGNINSSTFINLNEITTTTSVFSLAPYMTSFSHVGSGSSDAAALATAFGNVSQLVNISTGTVPGHALQSQDTEFYTGVLGVRLDYFKVIYKELDPPDTD